MKNNTAPVSIVKTNDFVVRFANVNGTGSASANTMFAKSIFRMGVPMSAKNIFPSNIQGLPTWYEVRVSGDGWMGRRAGIDLLVAVNPQSLARDVASVQPGGWFVYDSTKPLAPEFRRDDIHYIGIPMTAMTIEHYTVARSRQLYKNMIYVGAVATLLDMDWPALIGILENTLKKKPNLIPDNVKALELGRDFAVKNFNCPLPIRLQKIENHGLADKIVIDGNKACALGAVYAGATVAAWYPITPSTSVVDAFTKYAQQLRLEPDGRKKFAIVKSEDELAAIGTVIGASWNGARSFTATSGPGVSLMAEFLGLAYFAEIPTVLIDVQRTGPSTGMPTRTQQSDIIAAAYASHGDTRHVLIFPATPKECFDLTAQAFDLAERLQTPVIVMTDLDLGMNEHISEPLVWDENRKYDRGKVLNAEDLERAEQFGRYLDVDGDGITYRTLPGTHPTKGSFFTRGTSRDEFARYTEEGAPYVRNMERLLKKWQTASTLVPGPEFYPAQKTSSDGLVFFGTSTNSCLEACEMLKQEGVNLDAMRIRAFPFSKSVEEFIENHDRVFVVEQNRDGQMRSLLINELEINPKKLVKVLNFDGMPITADFIKGKILG